MTESRKRNPEYFTCPHCGADVPVGALACRECGSDAETGWSEDADAWNADTSGGYGDDEFDYGEFLAREFPGEARVPAGRRLRIWGLRIQPQ